MPEPHTVRGNDIMRRFQKILEARGIAHTPAGPIDDAPTPDEPGHPEYHRRQRTEIALMRWRNATPYRYQEATATHPTAIAWADRAANDLRSAGLLLLTGPVGTGKTHQAYGALRRIAEAAPARYELVATTAPDLYGRLRPGGTENGTEHELKRLAKAQILLIDDLGTEKLSEFTEEMTYRILNERYNNCRPLIITSNYPARSANGEDLTARLGDRIGSRLAQMTTVVAMEGPDLRRRSA